MSLLPFFANHLSERLLDQNFGLALTPEDLLTATMSPMLSKDYYRPWRHAIPERDFGSTVKADKEKMQINLDVQHFAPEEISVKVSNEYIVIEGKHEERKDEHSFISRQFTRRYALPQDCKPESVESSLSTDGVLSVIAPRISQQSMNVRSVPITQTGPIKKAIKDSAKAEVNGPMQEQ